jgi:hypothetical protein
MRSTAFGLTTAMLILTAQGSPADWFGIQVVDDATGRGVPLVELETVNHLVFVTDNGGWAAVQEPGWEGRPVFFSVRSHGYTHPTDGFGQTGAALTVKAGGRSTLKVHRASIAERLYRVTGEGLYRDSRLLGHAAPLAEALLNGEVAGQDSAQTAVYQNKLFWFWGDTQRLRYPLGLFHTAGAWSVAPGRGGLDPANGVDLHYWINADGFCREMCPLDGKDAPYLVWVDGVAVVPDAGGRERLVAHYTKLKTLGAPLTHGMAVWDDDKQRFNAVSTLPMGDTWRFLRGHPVRTTMGGADVLLSGDNAPDTRVEARYEAVVRPDAYEAYTCLEAGSPEGAGKAQRHARGAAVWAWKRDARPANGNDERRWLAEGIHREADLRLTPVDAKGHRVKLHNGATAWNPRIQRWVMIAVESGGTSELGEIWMATAKEPTGPWKTAVKVLTHDHYTFYNPVQHPEFTGDGRFLYFEGTYANTFSGNPVATPRYDYNQVMYRIDLEDPRLKMMR